MRSGENTECLDNLPNYYKENTGSGFEFRPCISNCYKCSDGVNCEVCDVGYKLLNY